MTVSNIIKRQEVLWFLLQFIWLLCVIQSDNSIILPLECQTGLRQWCCGKKWSNSMKPLLLPCVFWTNFRNVTIIKIWWAVSAGVRDITWLPQERTKHWEKTPSAENKWNSLSRTDLCLRSCYCSLVSGNVVHISSFHPMMKAKKCNFTARAGTLSLEMTQSISLSWQWMDIKTLGLKSCNHYVFPLPNVTNYDIQYMPLKEHEKKVHRNFEFCLPCFYFTHNN